MFKLRHFPFLPTFDNTPATELWNRHAADGAAGDQAPVVGVPHFLYVIVRNRGAQLAQNVTVTTYQSKMAVADTFPVHWKAVTGPSVAVANPIPAGGNVTVGPIEWTPTFAGQSVLVSVSADGDRSHADTVLGAVLNARLVPLDNNLAQRNL